MKPPYFFVWIAFILLGFIIFFQERKIDQLNAAIERATVRLEEDKKTLTAANDSMEKSMSVMRAHEKLALIQAELIEMYKDRLGYEILVPQEWVTNPPPLRSKVSKQ